MDVHNHVTKKSIEMRRQGFFGAAMLPMSELQYTGIIEKMNVKDQRFSVQPETVATKV